MTSDNDSKLAGWETGQPGGLLAGWNGSILPMQCIGKMPVARMNLNVCQEVMLLLAVLGCIFDALDKPERGSWKGIWWRWGDPFRPAGRPSGRPVPANGTGRLFGG